MKPNLTLIGCYPPPFGGQSVHIKELSRFLKERGYDVNVLNIGSGRKKYSDEYVKVANGVDFILKLVLFGIKANAFHHHANGHNKKSWILILLNSIVAGILKTDFFLTLHSGMCPGYIRSLPRCMKSLLKLCLKSARCIIAVNNEIYDALINLGIAAEKVRVIKAFSLTDDCRNLVLPRTINRYITNHHPLITCVGFPRREYGLYLIPGLIDNLVGNYPNMGMLIIGAEGPYEGEPVGNSRAVKWLGCQDRLISLYLIAHSDLFLRPSLKDGDAISVREALAFGVPVVASDVVHRPEGVMTFQGGNPKAFALAVEKALKTSKTKQKHPNAKDNSNLYKIMKCYETFRD